MQSFLFIEWEVVKRFLASILGPTKTEKRVERKKFLWKVMLRSTLGQKNKNVAKEELDEKQS